MSLLRFIRKDRDERKVSAVVTPAPAPVSTAVNRAEARVVTHAAPAASSNSALDLDRIRRELEEIARIIGSEDTASGIAASNDIMVDIKLADIIGLSPQSFKDPESLRNAAETTISVAVPRLFEQLSKGKAVTKLSHLLADIPVDYLTSYADEHCNDSINLPLHMVVASVQPGELRKRTSAVEKDLGDKNLPNLFGSTIPSGSPAAPVVEYTAQPRAPEPVQVPEVVATPVPEPEPVVAEAAPDIVVTDADIVVDSEIAAVEAAPAVEPESVAAEPEPVTYAEPEGLVELEPVVEPELESLPTREPELSPVAEMAVPEPIAEREPAPSLESADELGQADDDKSFRLVLGGLDLNSATAEEMHQRLGGVGLKLARKIVEVRQAQGPFGDLYDLARVPGLRAKRFEQVTGLSWNAAHFRYRDVVKQLVGVSDGGIPDIRQVTARFSELTGFVGCMVIHEDGLVLAGNWNHASADALGAFAPQMFKKINRYVKPLRLGEMKALCFFVGHQPITVIHSGRIYFAALHEPDSLSKKQVSIAQALAMELGRRFSS